jgi:hypothetical protein
VTLINPKEKQMNQVHKLDAHVIEDDKAVVNVGKHGGYVMVESIPSDRKADKIVLITIFNDIGDVIHEYEINLDAKFVDAGL